MSKEEIEGVNFSYMAFQRHCIGIQYIVAAGVRGQAEEACTTSQPRNGMTVAEEKWAKRGGAVRRLGDD